jgi:hypothetical protein
MPVECLDYITCILIVALTQEKMLIRMHSDIVAGLFAGKDQRLIACKSKRAIAYMILIKHNTRKGDSVIRVLTSNL